MDPTIVILAPAPETNGPRKNHHPYFWIFLIISIVVLTTLLIIKKDFIDLFPPLILLFLIMMYSFSSIHRKKMTSPPDYLTPLFVTLSISFGIISFTFGLHSESFAPYDTETTATNIDRDNWFKTSKVLNLPLSQLGYKKHPIPSSVDFVTLKDTTPTYNIIIVDKTASIKTAGNGVNKYILKQIKAKFSISHNIGDEYNRAYNTAELLPPYLLAGLFEKNKNQPGAKDYVAIFYYTGNLDEFVSPYKNPNYGTDVKDLTSKNSTFIKDYFDEDQKFKKLLRSRKQTTSFSQIISLLKDAQVYTPFENHDVNLSIISDFLNSSPNDPIPELSELKHIKSLNLYVLNGKDSGNPDEQPTQLIDKMTRRFSNLHQKTIINFANVDAAKNFYDELWISNLPVFDQNTNGIIPFYFPYKDFNTNQAAVST